MPPSLGSVRLTIVNITCGKCGKKHVISTQREYPQLVNYSFHKPKRRITPHDLMHTCSTMLRQRNPIDFNFRKFCNDMRVLKACTHKNRLISSAYKRNSLMLCCHCLNSGNVTFVQIKGSNLRHQILTIGSVRDYWGGVLLS